MILGRAALAVVMAAPGPLAAQAGAVLERAAERYAQVATLRATFMQVIENAMLGRSDTTRGMLFLERPDRFAMRFTEPAGDRIVADDEVVWVYVPSTAEGQVFRLPLSAAGITTPDLFDQFLDRPDERYDATLAGTVTIEGDVLDVVRLEPKSSDMPFRSAIIAIARSDGMVRRLEIREHTGQRRTLFFSEFVVNGDIPDDELTFSPPPGTRIIEQP